MYISRGNFRSFILVCSKLNTFWSHVFQCFSEVYNCNVIPNPSKAILGRDQHIQNLSRLQSKTIKYGMVVAKRIILALWESETVPFFQTWFQEVINLLHTERIRYSISLNSTCGNHSYPICQKQPKLKTFIFWHWLCWLSCFLMCNEPFSAVFVSPFEMYVPFQTGLFICTTV